MLVKSLNGIEKGLKIQKRLKNRVKTWNSKNFVSDYHYLPQKLKQCLVKIELTSGEPVTPEKTRVCL